MGSKHSPPRWWNLGGIEEAFDKRLIEREEESRRKHAEIDALFESDWQELWVERHDLSMGCRVPDDRCGVCGTKTCMHAYQQHPPPLTEQQKIDQDVYILGTGFGFIEDDGSVRHLPADKVIVHSNTKKGGANG